MASLPRSVILSAILSTVTLYIPTAGAEETGIETVPGKALQILPFKAFTGKVLGNKVRIRLQPAFEGSVLREASKGEMFIVIGENEDFYAIKPPKSAKGYVYRTFILDNTVEGNHVNVRLEPNTESPVVAQLNQGDKVNGELVPNNPKWIEIELPETAFFYVSKEYIEKAGEADLLAKIEHRREQVTELLKEAQEKLLIENQVPYEKSAFNELNKNLNAIISHYSDFPEQQAQAKEALAKLQEDYLLKKMKFLEQQTKLQAENLNNKTQQLEAQFSQKQKQLDEMQRNIETQIQTNLIVPPGMTPKMLTWKPVEEKLYQVWAEEHPEASVTDFYAEQRNAAVTLKGTIEPYERNVKNKPGDYMLVNAQKLPIAYLYSTLLNLEDWVGKQVTIEAAPRPNNQFAFKAYFVLSID